MRPWAIAALATGVLALGRPASAELAFFTSGRNLSISSHRIDGASIVMTLRGGGEIVCDQALITEIRPDEVPYPDPPAMAAAGPARSAAYAEIIDSISKEQGVDARIVHAMIQVESGYRPDARSPKGAMGLMQLMPQTARQYAVRRPFDPRSNVEGGVRHLKTLLDRFELSSALAAYNAGEAAVLKFGGIPPYRETQGYVSQILQLIGR